MIKVKLKKLHPDAQIPKKSNDGDFCYDVWAVDEEEVAPNVWRYKLGFAYEISTDEYPCFETIKGISSVPNISIDFRPRSSIWKTGMVLSNAIGTLDEFYRGEVMAVFYHVLPNMPRYKKGDRIGQIKIGLTIPIEFEWADEINMETERGEGGFGSTGTN